MDKLSHEWFTASVRKRYSYGFSWLGVQIIQYPQDIVAIQELIWKVKPELVVETGIAHGGSLLLSASMLHLLGGTGQVLGVDIDIRPHNRETIENHPLFNRIEMIEGSSIDPEVVRQVHERATGKESVMVMLDSNHTHDHVLAELHAYQDLVGPGGYLVVFDTVVDDLPEDMFPDRPWGPGDNPKTAVRQFLKENHRFEIDRELEERLGVTVAPDGYLRCIGQADD